MRWAIGTRPKSKTLMLIGLFLLCAIGYGVFAWQGPLPLMSPDETASFALARQFGQTGALTIIEPRAAAFSWLHPRSLVAQNGVLLPVGFPLWTALLALVGWIGSGGAVLWLAVLVCASFVIPLAKVLEERLRLPRPVTIAITLAIGALPTMIVYGNRSLFTLVPQLALAMWTVRLTLRSGSEEGNWSVFGAGLLAAVSIGLRPVEAVWLLPLFVGVLVLSVSEGTTKKRVLTRALLGFMVGAGTVFALHAWIYGSPFAIGYLLRDTPVPPTYVSSAGSASAWWRPFFPYGFSPSQWWQNVRGAWSIGWWPWIVVWGGAFVFWLTKARALATRAEKAFVVWLCATTAWLSFYYGQGRFADNIGGQIFHLGNSLFRYQTPFIAAWTGWSLWALWTYLPKAWGRYVVFAIVVLQVALGAHWAFADDQDGLLVNRQQRVMYADMRRLIDKESVPETIWLSERSDKMVFPVRASASPLPTAEEIRRFLKERKHPVWIFRRPIGQQERDQLYAQGLELIQKYAFERENIYEVRLRPGF